MYEMNTLEGPTEVDARATCSSVNQDYDERATTPSDDGDRRSWQREIAALMAEVVTLRR